MARDSSQDCCQSEECCDVTSFVKRIEPLLYPLRTDYEGAQAPTRGVGAAGGSLPERGCCSVPGEACCGSCAGVCRIEPVFEQTGKACACSDGPLV